MSIKRTKNDKDAKSTSDLEADSHDDIEESERNRDEVEMLDYQYCDPLVGSYYFKRFEYGLYYGSCQWLNNDILTFKIYNRSPSNKRVTCQMFFSIAQHRIIGAIDDKIVELFMHGNQIDAFTISGGIYRIILAPLYATQQNQRDEDLILRVI